MIKLFEFQQKEIRTEVIGSDIWFSGQDVFSVLGLTWKGSRDLKDRNISLKWICKRGGDTIGGVQEMVFINEQALYKIVFRANKSEIADAFTDWVAELLVRIRKGELKLVSEDSDLKKHLDVSVQKAYSKQVNAKNFSDGGVEQTIDYNRRNCQLHTNKQPNEIVKIGKDFGLKSKQTTSAKEVIRNLKPELACSMSFTDKLVSENGIEHTIAAKTSLELAQPLFKRLMELGLAQKQLN
jgi:prophage antirepressor-like protein